MICRCRAAPNVLVLYCPAFDGIDIWFVKTKIILEKTRAEAPGFLPHLKKFIRFDGGRIRQTTRPSDKAD